MKLSILNRFLPLVTAFLFGVISFSSLVAPPESSGTHPDHFQQMADMAVIDLQQDDSCRTDCTVRANAILPVREEVSRESEAEERYAEPWQPAGQVRSFARPPDMTARELTTLGTFRPPDKVILFAALWS